jgi:ADP-heptose:LPS heptosyltransferase
LPALQHLRTEFPDTRIIILCSEIGRQVFEGTIANIECVASTRQMSHGWRSLALIPKYWRRLRGQTLSGALCSSDEPAFVYILGMALGVQRRIGFSAGFSFGERLLTECIPLNREKNVVELNLDLAMAFTGNRRTTPCRVPLVYTADDAQHVSEALKPLGIPPGAPFVAMHPWAKLEHKEWPLERFVALGKLIEKDYSLPVIFISDTYRDTLEGLNVLAGLTIKQLACVLEHTRLFIGNNSGPLHVAAAMGTATVSLLGPSPLNWSVYWRDAPHRTIARNDMACAPCIRLGQGTAECENSVTRHGCLLGISVKEVLEVCEDVFSRLTPADGFQAEEVGPPPCTGDTRDD